MDGLEGKRRGTSIATGRTHWRRAAESSVEASEAAQEGMEMMDEIAAQTERTVTEVETLDDQMDEIMGITELITDIAEQTNLLALNANVEAARAGGDGGTTSGSAEGFTVVTRTGGSGWLTRAPLS